MATVGMCVAMFMSAILLWAGLAKSTNLGTVASTIQDLGVPAKWSNGISCFVSVSEVMIALGVTFAPNSGWTLIGVVVLGGAFALVGLVAMFRKKRIRCNCFGATEAGGYLGIRQVFALPAWVGGALVLYYGIPSTLPIVAKASLFAATGLSITTLKSISLCHAVCEARGDRLSAQEMLLWLPQR